MQHQGRRTAAHDDSVPFTCTIDQPVDVWQCWFGHASANIPCGLKIRKAPCTVAGGQYSGASKHRHRGESVAAYGMGVFPLDGAVSAVTDPPPPKQIPPQNMFIVKVCKAMGLAAT